MADKIKDKIQELLTFMTLDSRADLKSAALQYVLGLTVSDEGKKLVNSTPDLLKCVFELLLDSEPAVSSTAHVTILNLSSTDDIRNAMLDIDVIPKLLDLTINPEWTHADKVCMILSNLTHSERGANELVKALQNDATSKNTLHQLADIFDRKEYNKNADFHYLATVFLNLSRVATVRDLFLNSELCVLPRLLPYTQYAESSVRRGGVVGLIKNLSFQVACHEWLLGEEVDLLPSLLLPLAGPEQFTEEEMNLLPEELQYLPDDKRRETDPGIRKMCLEALMKLCSTRFGRKFLRSKQTYPVLRVYHQWETDKETALTCEKVVHMLIADEPEEGMENLHQVELPDDFTPSKTVIAGNFGSKSAS